MAKTPTTDLEILEQSRVALENAVANSEIAAALVEVGYNKAKTDKGKTLLAAAQDAYNINKQENVETSIAYNAFDQKRRILEVDYRIHRKRAKVYFNENAIQLIRLNINKPIPRAYLKWIDSIKRFYTEATSNPNVITALQTLKIDPQKLLATQALISEIEALRQTHINKKGQAQNATKIKNQAIKVLEHWMRVFYNVAEIALEDQPQLLESLS